MAKDLATDTKPIGQTDIRQLLESGISREEVRRRLRAEFNIDENDAELMLKNVLDEVPPGIDH